MDCWDPDTFDSDLRIVFQEQSDLIVNFYRENERIMYEHLNSKDYESLKPNKYYVAFSDFLDHTLTPKVSERRFRVWHYTRLLDHEVESIKEKVNPSTLENLKNRLDNLVSMSLLTLSEANTIFKDSPFQTQAKVRANRFWVVTVPIHPEHHAVKPLLESWGGESAYFWQTDEKLLQKLCGIGLPRIIELETELKDGTNASRVAKTATQAWAKSVGVNTRVEYSDIAITNGIKSTQVLNIHTLGDELYSQVARTYPEACHILINEND